MISQLMILQSIVVTLESNHQFLRAAWAVIVLRLVGAVNSSRYVAFYAIRH